jgi:signal transduction histidine kinase
MVTDFLDISKIEQGLMAYSFRSLDIRAMLQDLVEEFTPIATEKGLNLVFEYPEGETFVVTADQGKTRQVLSNLIDNAIKYTPKGRVDVTLQKNTAAGTITCRVKDTGIGLSEDDIQHLFGKFTRVDSGRKEYTDGSGLGLYVAKKMMEGQHGKITVDSDGPGKGSVFMLEFLAEEDETSQIPSK